MKRIDSTRVSKNKHGFRGVEWRENKKKFAAVICGINHRGTFLGYFKTAEDAALAYDKAARLEYGENAFLNFPIQGEKSVIQSRLHQGLCPKGHDLEIHGKINNRGQKFCKRCNADAIKRYYKKKKSEDD